VEAAAKALKHFGHAVESVRIPALERDFALDVFSRLHVLEMKPAVQEATAGRNDEEISYMAKYLLSLPDTPMKEYIDAEQAVERLKDGYAEYFQKYDVLLTPVLPTPAFKHRQEELLINGQTVGAMGIMSATSPLNVTGLPGVSMRFGTSKEGMPIGLQIVGSWQTESTILHIASLLEQVSPVRDLHPNL
jgi:aspartyl-tRNA(Asn)/glutamyl-tRNA(Gln) amidotransferase subunit A